MSLGSRFGGSFGAKSGERKDPKPQSLKVFFGLLPIGFPSQRKESRSIKHTSRRAGDGRTHPSSSRSAHAAEKAFVLCSTRPG